MNGQQTQPPPAQTDPTKVVPTVDLIGPGGTVKVNESGPDFDRLRGDGYQTAEEYSKSKAEEAKNANKSNKGGSSAGDGESAASNAGDKPETAKERKAREKREREAAESREHSEDAKVGSGEGKGDDDEPEFKG